MEVTKVITLDIRGQICPSCLLLTLKELNLNAAAIRAGASEVVVLTDDRQAITTIPAATSKMGFVTAIHRTENGYRIRISAR